MRTFSSTPQGVLTHVRARIASVHITQRQLASLLSLAVVVLIGAKSIAYVTPLRPGPDAGVYSSVAMQVLEGRALYRETPEAKPPVIFMLNAAALALGDGTFHSIRKLERVWCIAGLVLLYLAVHTAFRKRSVALLAVLAMSYLAYNTPLLEEGNITEEYALVFVLGGILCVLRAGLHEARPSPRLLLAAGLLFCCAVLSKEPFVLSSLPWFAYLTWKRGDGWQGSLRRGGYFVAGALIPVGLFLTYLVIIGSAPNWFEKTFGSFAFITSFEAKTSFAERFGTRLDRLGEKVVFVSRAAAAAFVVGLAVALAFPRLAARYRYVPCVAAAAFVFESMGATLGATLYGHYFLQAMPSFILLVATAAAILVDACDGPLHARWRGRALLVAIPLVLDYSGVVSFKNRLQQPFVAPASGEIARVVRLYARPGDHLWISPLSHSRFYIETGLTSPITINHLYPGWLTDTWSSTSQQKLQRLKSGLAENPPAWLVLGADSPSLTATGLLDWMCQHYTPIPASDRGHMKPAYLYARNDRAGEVAGQSSRPRDGRCAALHAQRGAQAGKAEQQRLTALAPDRVGGKPGVE